MKVKIYFRIIGLMILFCLIMGYAISEVSIVENGEPKATIVISEKATDLEKYAAEEFVKYIKEMTGAKLKITSSSISDGKSLIVIGRSNTNPIISRLITRNKIRLESEYPGLDGFIISTVEDEGKQILVLGGSMDRGTLYAVYHLLENYLGVGFFENGDQIPRVKSISVDKINYAYKPRFRLRINQQGCAWSYSYRYWDLEKYKVLVDWMVKKKYNTFWWLDAARVTIIKNVFKNRGLDYDKIAGQSIEWMTPGWEEHEVNILRDVAQYAMSRGIDLIGPCPIVDLPESFLLKYPDAKILRVDWAGLVKKYYLHPKDPMFAVIQKDSMKEFENIIGNKLYWWTCPPYPELTFENVKPEEVANLYVDFVDGTYRALSSLRPEFGWLMSGWSHYCDPHWTPERSSIFFNKLKELFGKDRFCISDPEAYYNPIYKKFNGFEGVGWCFGIIHSYGGTTELFGDLVHTKNRILECLNSEWSENLYGYWVQPEIIGHNYFFYEAVSEMGWDPIRFSLEEFAQRFVKNRYSGIGSDNLMKAWQKIIEAYYSDTTFEDQPVYWVMPGTRDYKRLPERFKNIILVREALDYFLKEKDKLRDNQFYQLDLIDILKQYNANLYNYHYYKMMEAFNKGDKSRFEQEATRLKEILKAQVVILKTHPSKYVGEEIIAARKLPQENVNYSNDVAIRQRLTSLLPIEEVAEKKSGIIDYARRDLVELIRDYYLPRVEVHIHSLRKSLEDGKPAPALDDLRSEYYRICREFINTPFNEQIPEHPIKNLADIAEETFSKQRVDNNEISLSMNNGTQN